MIFTKVTLWRALATLAATLLVYPANAALACDRACLNGAMDGYMKSLLAHDSASLPAAPNLKFTENTNTMPLGDGLWRTIDSLGSYHLFAADPSTGQAMLYTTARENGQPVFLSVRLKLEDGKLTEVEQFVVRKIMHISGSYDGLRKTEAVWAKPLAPPERVPREQMIKAVNAYFEGIEKGKGVGVPFDPEATRILNGGKADSGLQAEMDTGIFNYIEKVTDRRFLVVDEETGIVSGTFMFQHPGNIKLPVGAKYMGKEVKDLYPDPNAVSLSAFPNTTEIIEAFKIRNGKLYRIFGYISLLPYHQSPGW